MAELAIDLPLARSQRDRSIAALRLVGATDRATFST